MSHEPKVVEKYLAKVQLNPDSTSFVGRMPNSRYQWTFGDGGVHFKIEAGWESVVTGYHPRFLICHCSDSHSVISTTTSVKEDGQLVFGPKALEVTKDFSSFWSSDTYLGNWREWMRSSRIEIEVAFKLPISAKPTHDTGSTFMQMLYAKTFTDCVFKIGDDEIKAHRCILAQHSNVFSAMFSQQSTNEAKNGIIEIKDSECVSVHAMLEYMYSGTVKLNADNVEGVMFLADKYDVKPLREGCINCLIAGIDANNILRTAVIGDLYSSLDIIQNCGEYLKKNHPAIFASADWEELKNTNHKLAIRLFELSY